MDHEKVYNAAYSTAGMAWYRLVVILMTCKYNESLSLCRRAVAQAEQH